MLPEESDQLMLHCHSAISPLGLSSRSHAAHLDEFVYSGQVTLPEESDKLRLHYHSTISPLSLSARSHAAHLDEFIYSGQVTLPEELDQHRLHCHSATAPNSATRFDELSQNQVVQPKESIQLMQVRRWTSSAQADEPCQK